MNLVRKNGLRRGDSVTGVARIVRDSDNSEGKHRQKFNPLVRLDTINGDNVESFRARPNFSTALYPPKRFLGAARHIEDGGSLTIIATALVETGSTGDTVIFEEFKGTSNAELKLDRRIAERRVFPAVDMYPSSTRKDQLLMSVEEYSNVHTLRSVLAELDARQALELLISRLEKTRDNAEFLLQVHRTAPNDRDTPPWTG